MTHLTTAPKGKFRLIGVDTFHPASDHEDWLVSDFDDLEQAITRANKEAVGAEESWSMYYVYSDQGETVYKVGSLRGERIGGSK